MNRYYQIPLLVIIVSVAGTFAYAEQNAIEHDTANITQTTISLVQAVNAAEHHLNGKAIYAEYKHSEKTRRYDVEVSNGTKVFDVRIDADKGTVVAVNEDSVDQDDGQDAED